MSDDRATADGWPLPIDRVGRLRLLCDAYGLDGEDRSVLLPTAVRNASWGYDSHKAWGEAGRDVEQRKWSASSGRPRLAGGRLRRIGGIPPMRMNWAETLYIRS